MSLEKKIIASLQSGMMTLNLATSHSAVPRLTSRLLGNDLTIGIRVLRQALNRIFLLSRWPHGAWSNRVDNLIIGLRLSGVNKKKIPVTGDQCQLESCMDLLIITNPGSDINRCGDRYEPGFGVTSRTLSQNEIFLARIPVRDYDKSAATLEEIWTHSIPSRLLRSMQPSIPLVFPKRQSQSPTKKRSGLLFPGLTLWRQPFRGRPIANSGTSTINF